MDSKDQAKNLLEMARGGVMERVDMVAPGIFDNIRDYNTKATAKREMVIKVTFIPDDERKNVHIVYDVSTKLASPLPLTTSMYIAGQDSRGYPIVVENTPNIPGQIDLYGGEQEPAAVLRLIK